MRILVVIAAILCVSVLNAQAPSLPPGAWAGTVLMAKVSPAYNTYRVRPGDTLFSIAEKFYGSGHGHWELLASENKVTPDNLKTGMILRIPIKPKLPAPDEAPASPAEKNPGDKKKVKHATVGDSMDAVGKRIGALTTLLGLEFTDGPSYAFKVVLLLFLCCILYVSADALMVWFGSIILRVPEATLGRAGKISVSSLGLQLLLVLSLLMFAAVANQIVPDSAKAESLRSLSWGARWVWWSAALTCFLAFFFIPFTMAKQTYAINAGRAGGIVLLAGLLKCFIAFFPSAAAFVATGAGVVQ